MNCFADPNRRCSCSCFGHPSSTLPPSYRLLSEVLCLFIDWRLCFCVHDSRCLDIQCSGSLTGLRQSSFFGSFDSTVVKDVRNLLQCKPLGFREEEKDDEPEDEQQRNVQWVTEK